MSANGVKTAAAIMSVLFVLLLVVSITTVKMDLQNKNTSPQSFKDFITNMIKEQSTKIQTLLKKIQTNAQTVLEKMENMKESKLKRKKLANVLKANEIEQLESPLKTNVEIDTYKDAKLSEARSFSNHYAATSYGASGNANYGTPTYHHYSIGFDPVNIVVSLSLLSFLLQALQGLLTRTKALTPVVEARSLNAIEDWAKSFESKMASDKYYLKKKYMKNYY